MTKKLFAVSSVIAMSTLIATTSFAAGQTTPPASAAAPWLNIDGQVNLDSTGSSTANYEQGLRLDASLRLEVILREGIKAVVKARLLQDLTNAGGVHSEAETKEIDQMIEEAYIEVETDKVSGLPRAIIRFGKQSMAFGQQMEQLPFFRDGLLDKLNNERGMIGVTVELPTDFLKVVDSVAISLYETGPDDFKISSEHGVSIKLSKKLSDHIQAQVSALVKDNEGSNKRETRESFGFVYDSGDGKYQVWADGILSDGNPATPDSHYGAELGGSMKAGLGTVVVDYQYLNNYAQELAVAYAIPVGHNLTLSPEVRERWHDDGTDETIVGVQARVNFDQNMKKQLKAHPQG